MNVFARDFPWSSSVWGGFFNHHGEHMHDVLCIVAVLGTPAASRVRASGGWFLVICSTAAVLRRPSTGRDGAAFRRSQTILQDCCSPANARGTPS